MELSRIKPNPANPRVIKDYKFKQLLKSIQDFPEMMEKRPMVCVTDVDKKIFPLGGNMRYRAIIELGYKEIPDNWVIMADDWTEEKRREFVIKDNVAFGEWNHEELANEWDTKQLQDWGLELPNYAFGHDANNMTEEDIDTEEEFDPIGQKTGKRIVQFIFDGDDEAKSFCTSINCEIKIHSVAWRVDLSSQST